MNRRIRSQDTQSPSSTLVEQFTSAANLAEQLSVIKEYEFVPESRQDTVVARNGAETPPEPETALDSVWEDDLEGFEKAEDPVRIYLREIGRIRLLKKTDEYNLARRIEACKYVESQETEHSSVDGELRGAWVCVAQLLP